jgi:hypothetical protein
MRIRLLAAFSFAFAIGISLAFAPVETWARAGGVAGRAGVNAGVPFPHPFVHPNNPHFAQPLRPPFARPFHGNFGRFLRFRDRDGGFGAYGAEPNYYPPSYDPGGYPLLRYPAPEDALRYRRECDFQTVQVPSEYWGGYRSVNIVRC